MFFRILIFDQNGPFWQVYSLCKIADFQNDVIFGIFGIFSSGFFAHNYFKVLVESISSCFLELFFLTQTDHFGKAIGFGKWLIFKMVSFLEYLVLFRAVFCTQLF